MQTPCLFFALPALIFPGTKTSPQRGAGQLASESVAAATPNQPMMSASSWPDPAPGVFMQAEAPQSEQRRTDEIAQRFAGFFFRVLATEPEKVDLHPHAVRAGCCRA